MEDQRAEKMNNEKRRQNAACLSFISLALAFKTHCVLSNQSGLLHIV